MTCAVAVISMSPDSLYLWVFGVVEEFPCEIVFILTLLGRIFLKYLVPFQVTSPWECVQRGFSVSLYISFHSSRCLIDEMMALEK